MPVERRQGHVLRREAELPGCDRRAARLLRRRHGAEGGPAQFVQGEDMRVRQRQGHLLRKVLLPLPFFCVFVWAWQFEIATVWWIISGTNVFMTVITVVYAQWVLRHLGRAKMGV